MVNENVKVKKSERAAVEVAIVLVQIVPDVAMIQNVDPVPFPEAMKKMA